MRMLRWVWNNEHHRPTDQTDLSTEIAFASTSIQTKDVMGSSFSYAKIMTLPFFGAGVVDIPPGGFKRAKNSRKMQMIFFVHTGKVLVTVADLEFSISTGGAWQVPRGESFSCHSISHCIRPRFNLSRWVFVAICPSLLNRKPGDNQVAASTSSPIVRRRSR